MQNSNFVCPHCGAQVPAKARFCKACGAAVEAAPAQPQCPRCGAHVPVNARFCKACGASLAIAPVASSPAARPLPQAQLQAVGSVVQSLVRYTAAQRLAGFLNKK